MRMAQTYETASHVIILSEELLMGNLPASPLQALYMIFYSKWMTRLWTLQEAILARRLLFRFRDQPITFSTLSDAIIESPEAPLVNEHSLSPMAGLNMLTQMRLFEGEESNSQGTRRTLSLDDLLWALQPRSHLHPILAAPDNMKMQAFWASPGEIPVGVLWARGARNLLNPLTRQSLLGAHADETTPATMTPGGLVISGVAVFLMEKLPLGDGSLPALVFDFYSVVTDFNIFIRIHVEEGISPRAEIWARDQFLLLVEEFEYTKAMRCACVALPLQSLETVRDKEQLVKTRYLLNAGIEVMEEGSLSSEDRLRPAVKIAQVFESSQSWIMT
ncbi:uncharacterized protein Z519_04673 [Cladophialophora bantiana CBS 173.52]|uniref:Heterokaryon incompatibility domain-containing protein n=1 Tax=Cladophialophora bantiana (strain ATCC 10958 / CBS 173.52 / CDC B-1940 / NIH 8579) TaxID=1442370 RepID=A0A0D2EXK6_CLAB1|nr:uncharacterized protein Z519_04673 [Cladophialophora bantiana CBS 173.52]KIW94696.1 hypothetical protein Z519_04673 [Cladophialophora bantiana CBS 173.52]